MDDGYTAMSQVSGTTMCKISYSWAHQPLAEISVYSKKNTRLQPPAWAWQIFGMLWELQQLCPGSRPHEKPGQGVTVDCQEWGMAGGPLVRRVTQHEQSQRAVLCSMPMHGRRHAQRAWPCTAGLHHTDAVCATS